MICYNCGYKQNPTDAEKCMVCGAGFSRICSICRSPNPKLAKFCFNCGSSFQSRVKTIKNSIQLEENRKNVAVLFADISGFTSISEKLDPEEARKIVNDCFQYITKPVYELEGTIDKYMGDCVMVLFGARYTHNDDSKRAVKCAMRMMQRIGEYSSEVREKIGNDLNLSIGINYGLVVTGKVGNSYDDDYTVMGDVVNTAQRLQTSAGRGNILVSGEVYDETNDLFHYSEKKVLKVKNREKPVDCYTPISIVAGNSMDEALVPRLEELEVISKAFKGRDSINRIHVSGESGLGKTTLVKTFLASAGEEIKPIWINCSSMLRERPYGAIASVISGILNIDPNDTARIKTNRLKSFLDYILKDLNEDTIIKNYNFIALVMGLERDPDYEELINTMEYSDLDREIKNQISLFFSRLLKRQNPVIIVDDMHLADRESLEILPALNDFSGFFIFISQFDEKKSEDEQNLVLRRFTADETEKLISLMTGAEQINKNFTEGIFNITDGNPMFIHEIVQTICKKNLFYIRSKKAYIRKGALETLPKNLRNTILRNLSDIGPVSMKFLKIASVAGSSFNLSWVIDLMGDGCDENEILKLPLKLKIIEFTTLQKTTETNDRIYSFTQDTIRKVIYESIVNDEKNKYHSSIAGIIERRYSRELSNYYEMLGFHYSSGNKPRLAKQYFLKSAERLKQNYVYKSAIDYYDKYIELEKTFVKKEENTELVNAMISLGEILISLAEYDKAFSVLEEASETAVQGENINNIKILMATVLKETARYGEALKILDNVESMLGKSSNLFGKALQLRCAIYIVTGQPGVIDLVTKSEKILLKSRDYSALADTMSQAGIKHFFSGNPGEAIEYFEKALVYANKANNQGIIAKVSVNMGIICHATGEIDKSFIYLSNAMKASEKISNPKGYLSAEINLGIFYMEKGLFNKAIGMFDDAILKSKQVNLLYQSCLALSNKADAEYEIGNYREADDLYRESLEIAQKYNMSVETGLNYLGMAKTEISMEEYDKAPGYLEKALEVFEDTEEVPAIGDYHYYKAIFHHDGRDYSKAMEEAKLAEDFAIKTNEDIKLTKAMRKKGDILRDMGEYEKALEEYDKSVGLSEESGSFYEMAKSYFCRYELYKITGNKEKADRDLLNASRHIAMIDYCKWTNTINDELMEERGD